jgi:uncharacterized protein
MSPASNPASWVLWGGFALAFIFGAVASRINFCTMGAVSDVVNMGHWGRARMWLLAIVAGMLGTNLLFYFGLVDLSKSLYLRPAVPWLSLLFGGALFGVGMTLAGGCANKNLLRLGGGSVRSLVVLAFMAISAYMTLKGLFGQWRAGYLDPVAFDLSKLGLPSQALSQVLGHWTGVADRTAVLATTIAIALPALMFIFKDKRFRGNLPQVAGSAVLGVLVVAAWYLTGHIGYGENPDTLETVYFATNSRTLESMSFVAPIAYSLEMLMLWTDKSLHVTFGIAVVLGVVLGSFAYAIASRQFRLEGFASTADLNTQLLGAMLMGFGGVTAIGCTIGQGLAGVSTLALGSFLALAAIVGGAIVTMKWQQR